MAVPIHLPEKTFKAGQDIISLTLYYKVVCNRKEKSETIWHFV